MSDDEDHKVSHIGIKPRRDAIPRSLVQDAHPWRCKEGRMGHGPYIVSEALAYVQCATCGQHLNPFFVLRELLHKESQFMEAHARYQDEMRRLQARQRTKCQHCGEMTRVSVR